MITNYAAGLRDSIFLGAFFGADVGLGFASPFFGASFFGFFFSASVFVGALFSLLVFEAACFDCVGGAGLVFARGFEASLGAAALLEAAVLELACEVGAFFDPVVC
jgi:hypothetical protein